MTNYIYLVPQEEQHVGHMKLLFGWKVYTDAETAKRETANEEYEGHEDWGYVGPSRPLRMYKMEYDKIPHDVKKWVDKKKYIPVSMSWNPKWYSEKIKLEGLDK